MNYHKLLSSLLTILISFSLHAQTADAFETVETNEVPEAVINGLKKQIDQSKEQLSEWRYDLSTFEAKVENKDATTYYRFNPEGRFLEKRTLLNWGKNAPVKLRNTKAKSYFKDSEVEEFYKATRFDGEVYYILQVRKDSDQSLHTLYFDDAGGLSEKSKIGY